MKGCPAAVFCADAEKPSGEPSTKAGGMVAGLRRSQLEDQPKPRSGRYGWFKATCGPPSLNARDPRHDSNVQALEQLLCFLQAAALAEDPKLLLVVTRGAHDPTAAFDGAVSLWGLVRSARIEMPRVIIKALDVKVTATNQELTKALGPALGWAWLVPWLETERMAQRNLSLAAAQADSADNDVEATVCPSSSTRRVPRVVEAPQEALQLQRQDAMRDAENMATQVKAGMQLVTGGLGGLGLVAAEELVALGAPGGCGSWWTVQLKACDAGKASDVASLLQEAKDANDPVRGAAGGGWSNGCGRISGVVHAAGILDRCPLPELDAGRLQKVLLLASACWLVAGWQVMGPKARGAWHLHDLGELELFVLFSSVSATIGYLDGLAAWRQSALSRHAVSLKWGPVSEAYGQLAAKG
eukprot:Skav203405  [mRNA]  locus=scaffold1743:152763:160037:- [translate_table: standard]